MSVINGGVRNSFVEKWLKVFEVLLLVARRPATTMNVNEKWSWSISFSLPKFQHIRSMWSVANIHIRGRLWFGGIISPNRFVPGQQTEQHEDSTGHALAPIVIVWNADALASDEREQFGVESFDPTTANSETSKLVTTKSQTKADENQFEAASNSIQLSLSAIHLKSTYSYIVRIHASEVVVL
jgi:hypothetical protein